MYLPPRGGARCLVGPWLCLAFSGLGQPAWRFGQREQRQVAWPVNNGDPEDAAWGAAPGESGPLVTVKQEASCPRPDVPYGPLCLLTWRHIVPLRMAFPPGMERGVGR